MKDNGDVYLVSPLPGLARRIGINTRAASSADSRGATKAHIARAALKASPIRCVMCSRPWRPTQVFASGTTRGRRCQRKQSVDAVPKRRFVPVVRPRYRNYRLGAAYLAGLAVGYWQSRPTSPNNGNRTAGLLPR